MNFEDKKILFMAPKHYYLEGKIIEALELMGADVTYYPEVLYSRVCTLIRDKIFHPLNKVPDRIYFRKILSEIKQDQFDVFFLIRGGSIDSHFMDALHKKLPNAYYVMYQWDSLVHNNYQPIIKYFNKTLSFDKDDADELAITYLPLFYTDEFNDIKAKQEDIFDISFFGTFHSDRLHVIKQVAKECKNKNLKFHYHLYAGKINLLFLLLRRKIFFTDLKYFKTYGASLLDIIEQYSISKAVLDVEMTNQVGLTLRTLEALGAGRKLLTTNINIKNSEIFDTNYIQILDRENPIIDIEFINSLIVDSHRYDEFHISKWVNTIFKI
jgi:hypothetical protein